MKDNFVYIIRVYDNNDIFAAKAKMINNQSIYSEVYITDIFSRTEDDHDKGDIAKCHFLFIAEDEHDAIRKLFK